LKLIGEVLSCWAGAAAQLKETALSATRLIKALILIAADDSSVLLRCVLYALYRLKDVAQHSLNNHHLNGAVKLALELNALDLLICCLFNALVNCLLVVVKGLAILERLAIGFLS
jgi:hypothetical protein